MVAPMNGLPASEALSDVVGEASLSWGGNHQDVECGTRKPGKRPVGCDIVQVEVNTFIYRSKHQKEGLK